jgi:hypothetical protein
MKMHTVTIRVLAAVGLFLLFGCAHVQATESEDMLTLGAALTKVTAAVDDEVRHGTPPAGLSEGEFLDRATGFDPGLMAPFKDYSVHFRIQDNTAFLLVCTQDGKVSLLEDAGCTYKLDLNSWREKNSPCKFTLQAKDVCPQATTQ